MITQEDIQSALDKMILSASGWRSIFDNEGEEGRSSEISPAYRIICGAAAYVFFKYISNKTNLSKKVKILTGMDTRPTGKAVIDAMIPVLLSCGCDVHFAGFTAAPEIMAWARKEGEDNSSSAVGFIYISASHNPIGHNGIKFGLADGGVLAAGETEKIILNFRSFFETEDCIQKINTMINSSEKSLISKVFANETKNKTKAYKAYYDFSCLAALGDKADITDAVRTGIAKRPLGIVCDFNGSARAASIDFEFFRSLGLMFDCINVNPGEIVHRIVPEGESLEPCRLLLERSLAKDPSFMLGYVPDCDGDRGNLVIWDDSLNKARALEAQEVFALACLAEFAHMFWTGEPAKAAVVVNDPTSMRIDRIAEAFGIQVFRAEVGEANVVGLARKKREEGYTVRILGEGSAGGNITHPSSVRDPIHTVIALVKLLRIRDASIKHPKGVDGFCCMARAPVDVTLMKNAREHLCDRQCDGLFEIWCRASGQMDKYKENFTLSDIISSLPQFITTSAYSKEAVMQVKSKDHAYLKNRYQEIFLREWEERKDGLKKLYGISSWKALAYNGMEEKYLAEGMDFGEAGKGGLKILFYNENEKPIAYIWMRGSATEPVFRIMADIEGSGENAKEFEQLLLNWQRDMISNADYLVYNT